MADTRTAAELRAEADRLERLAEQRSRQLTRDDLKTMTPDEVADAKRRGQLDTLLGIER